MSDERRYLLESLTDLLLLGRNVGEINESLKRIARALVPRPPRPSGVIELVWTGEIFQGGKTMFTFDLKLPLLVSTANRSAADTDKRKVSAVIPGVADPVVKEVVFDPASGVSRIDFFNLEANRLVTDAAFVAEQGIALSVTRYDIDDDGNESDSRVQDLVVTDKHSPPQPGDAELLVTGET